jgi:ATP-binding cassette subfamily F protein uup
MRSAEESAAESQTPASNVKSNDNASSAVSIPSRKLSYKEQRELEALETEIQVIESRLAELNREIPAAASDYVRLHKLTSDQAALHAQLESAMARWESLASRVTR